MENEVIIVTGGTKGIGKATSENLSNSGYNVIAIYANDDDNAKEFLKLNKNINVVNLDVTNFFDVNKFIENIENSKMKIVGLVNSAGVIDDGYFLMMSNNKWNNVINVNLNGTFNMCKLVLRHMRINKISKGSIVNLSSTSGISGQIGQANYSASKGAIISLSKTLSKEMAPYNIRVNSVSPGFIESTMTSNLKNKKDLQKLIPMMRFGKTEEVANLIEFLIGDKSSYITGKNITIDGGML